MQEQAVARGLRAQRSSCLGARGVSGQGKAARAAASTRAMPCLCCQPGCKRGVSLCCHLHACCLLLVRAHLRPRLARPSPTS